MAGVVVSAIFLFTREFNSWADPSAVATLVFIGLSVFSLIMGGVGVFVLRVRENNLILKQFGRPESKIRSYYNFERGHRDIRSILSVFGEEKIYYNDMKFTPEGLYFNDGRFKPLALIFLWEDVKRVRITYDKVTLFFIHDGVEQECRISITADEIHWLVMRKIDIFRKSIMTFWGGEIEEDVEGKQ
jgi:hypothetical protein